MTSTTIADDTWVMHHPKTWVGKYVWSQDHKVIAIQYGGTATAIGLVALVLSWLMRLQLGFPGIFDFITPEAYYQFVTMHGMIMVVYLLTALFLGGFGNYLIPLMVGARDMVFPYVNMLSYWVYLLAVLVLVASFFAPGGPTGAGWTLYPPQAILGGTPSENAQAFRALLDGAPGAYRDAVLLNAAAALVVADKAGTLTEGVALAKESIDSGAAKAKVEALRQGVMPIYEPGLEEMVRRNMADGRLGFTTDARAAVEQSVIVFICVGTPPKPDGETDLSYVEEVAREIALALNGYKVVVNAHPSIVDLLQTEERDTLKESERRYQRQILLVPHKEYHIEQFDLQGG